MESLNDIVKEIINIAQSMIKLNSTTLFFYLDMNNLYGDTISEYLPYGGFKWVKVNNETVSRILNKSSNSLHGYFLEVDLDFPENLHDYDNDYPMAPEKIKLEDDMLSPYCLEVKQKYDIKLGDANKLAPNLMSWKKYVVHYRI